MSEFPFDKKVTLRYIPHIYENSPPDVGVGGMYATAVQHNVELAPLKPEYAKSQKWRCIADGRGVLIQLCIDWPKQAGIGPVNIKPEWVNSSPAPDTPITLSQDGQSGSTYYLNVISHFKGERGWVVTICPMGIWIGVDRYIGASKGDQVDIVPEPIRDQTSCPGWLVEEAED